jgi:hypothetical protein
MIQNVLLHKSTRTRTKRTIANWPDAVNITNYLELLRIELSCLLLTRELLQVLLNGSAWTGAQWTGTDRAEVGIVADYL